jgi:hypothetical protein
MLALDIEELLVKALPIGACVLSGKNHVIEVVNEQMLAIWSKDPSVIGKPLQEAIPELRGQPFFDLITNVYSTGKAHHSPGALAFVMVNGSLEERYFNLSFKPLYNANGELCGVLNTAINITEKMNSSLAVRRLNEELLSAEEQLRSAVESSNLEPTQSMQKRAVCHLHCVLRKYSDMALMKPCYLMPSLPKPRRSFANK